MTVHQATDHLSTERATTAASRTGPVLLRATAARTCPVKTQNAFLPGLEQPDRPLDPTTRTRRAAQADRRTALLDAWVAALPGAADLRGSRVDARTAMTAGAPLIVGGTFPADPAGHRTGTPDAWVRAASEGRPRYHPVVVTGHHVVTSDPPPGREPDPAQALPYGTFADPAPRSGRSLVGRRLKTGSRLGDFLELAHHARLLAAAGFGPTEAEGVVWGGVIGSDEPTLTADGDQPQRIIGWLDLGGPEPTFGRPGPAASFLEKYDEEHWFRLAVAESARQQTGNPVVDPPLLVGPIVNAECATCPWWEICRPQLDDDDLGLRIERGRLRPRETLALRELGADTVGALARADLEPLVQRVLDKVGDRPGAETRLRTAARRARMLLADRDFSRETSGPIEVPGAAVEIDFDLETAANGHIYLWGFRVSEHGAESTRQFARFDDLDDAVELELAREALGWLRDTVGAAESARVYHYSGFEIAKLRQLADRTDEELLSWAAEYAERDFVDLLDVTKTHFFGVSGLGLKAIARHAGFRWRDPDPGGLNSQCWFDEAVHGPAAGRDAARRRVLEYNEDDVIATSRLRDWLRAQ